MAKRPTPKKRKAKSSSRTQHSAYVAQEVLRLRNLQQSPYAVPAEPKYADDQALKSITRIKA